ncbi:MAG: peptidoglycan DD-metalloendopeptidase family protein [Rhodospirillales bacterium]
MNSQFSLAARAVRYLIVAGAALAPLHAQATDGLLTPPVLQPETVGDIDVAAINISPAEPEFRELKVRRGDTLMKMLVNQGFGRSESHSAISALRTVYDPRKLRPGQTIRISLDPAADEGTSLIGLALKPDVDLDVFVDREADKFAAKEVKKALSEQSHRVDGEITSSLYEAAVDAGLPPAVLIELIQAMSFDVDFQRDIQPGDTFQVMFNRFHDETGLALRDGAINHARLTLSGKELRIYRYTDESGRTDFFDPKGHSIRKALLKTPVDGARISSRFGKRRHPILGYTKMHRGVDFAAPSGTPIYAAGDGVIEVSGWNGGYGKYVRLRHNGEYKTAYAHMKGISKNARKGNRVRQGQIIGWVGTTGRSTGAHLHYEVLRGSQQVNPLSIKLPTGKRLAGADLATFRDLYRALDREFDALPVVEPVVPAIASAN